MGRAQRNLVWTAALVVLGTLSWTILTYDPRVDTPNRELAGPGGRSSTAVGDATDRLVPGRRREVEDGSVEPGRQLLRVAPSGLWTASFFDEGWTILKRSEEFSSSVVVPAEAVSVLVAGEGHFTEFLRSPQDGVLVMERAPRLSVTYLGAARSLEGCFMTCDIGPDIPEAVVAVAMDMAPWPERVSAADFRSWIPTRRPPWYIGWTDDSETFREIDYKVWIGGQQNFLVDMSSEARLGLEIMVRFPDEFVGSRCGIDIEQMGENAVRGTLRFAPTAELREFRAHVRDLTPGEYQVRLSAHGEAVSLERSIVSRVDVVDDGQRVTIDIPRTARLGVFYSTDVELPLAMVRTLQGDRVCGAPLQDGVASLRLIPGRYSVAVYDRNRLLSFPLLVDIAPGVGAVDVSPFPARSMHDVVVAASAPVERRVVISYWEGGIALPVSGCMAGPDRTLRMSLPPGLYEATMWREDVKHPFDFAPIARATWRIPAAEHVLCIEEPVR